MASDLASQHCAPGRRGGPPLERARIKELWARLDAGWQVVDKHHLERRFTFKDFRQALDFTTLVGELAESQEHHPEIRLGWGRVDLKIWTYTSGGLTESDFILAAKIDRL
jgi:4a-hydroxytetrahydrobiopterin dehydratase